MKTYYLNDALGTNESKKSTIIIPESLVFKIHFADEEEPKSLDWIITNSQNLRATALWYLEFLNDNGITIDVSQKIFPLKVGNTDWRVKFWRKKSTGDIVRVSLYEEDYE